MDLNYLDKASKVVPMLVRLHDSQKLYDLARDKKPMAQEELSGAVAELIGMKTSERERELIADVLIGVVRQAEKELKMALSEKLSLMRDVPLRLVLYVANEEIDVAAPMLKNSPDLGELDLMYIVKSKPESYWRLIAQRHNLSDALINTLAETGDSGTVYHLLKNNDIVLPKTALAHMSAIAETEETIARPLLARPEIDAELAVHLYAFVGQELKRAISQRFDVPMAVMIGVVDETVLEFQGVAQSEYAPSRAMISAAERQHAKGLLSFNLILGNLRRGQIQSFIAQYSVLTGIAPKKVEEFLVQPKGNGAAALCKAFEIPKADFVTVFLLTNRMREQGRMLDVADMHRVVNYYNKLTKEMAETILHAPAEAPPAE